MQQGGVGESADMGSIESNPAAAASEEAYASTPVIRSDHAEDTITRFIEQQAAKIPSHVFLFAALGTMALAVVLELTGRQRASRFVGMWPSALLTTGVYNKLIKTLGAR